MPLTGPQRRELVEALLASFDQSSLRAMVRFELDLPLDTIADGSNFRELAVRLAEWAGLAKAGKVNATAMARDLKPRSCLNVSKFCLVGLVRYCVQKCQRTCGDMFSSHKCLATCRVTFSRRVGGWLNNFQKTTSSQGSIASAAYLRKRDSNSIVPARFPSEARLNQPGYFSASSNLPRSKGYRYAKSDFVQVSGMWNSPAWPRIRGVSRHLSDRNPRFVPNAVDSLTSCLLTSSALSGCAWKASL